MNQAIFSGMEKVKDFFKKFKIEKFDYEKMEEIYKNNKK